MPHIQECTTIAKIRIIKVFLVFSFCGVKNFQDFKKSLIHNKWNNDISPLRMAINIGYFGLSLNTSNLSGNPFMNCFLSAAAEVPAYIVSTFLLKKCPRKSLLSTFLIIGGGVILLIQFIPASK